MHSFMLPVQFLDTVLDMSVVVLRQVLGLMVQNTVVRPQLLFIGGRLPSFVPQRQIPMVQSVQQTTEIPQMPFVFRWSMPLLCRSCGSQVVYLRTQRTAWFDSGYMRCVSLRSFHIFYVFWLTVDPEVDSRPARFWRLLGSTVDTGLCVRLRRPYFSVMLGSTVDTSLCVRLRRPYFSVMLGSTVDTSLCVRLRRPYFSVMLGSTVDTSLCVRIRRLVFLVTIHLALCSFPVFRPVMLDIMASMDLKDSFMRGAAHHQGHLHSLSRRRVWFPWSTLFYRP